MREPGCGTSDERLLLPDIACYEQPAALYRLAGLTCTGYGSIANRTERSEQPGPGSYAVVYVYAGSGWIETAATAGRTVVEAGALVWLFPGVAHSFAPGSSGWSEQWALFEGPLAQTFEGLGLLSRTRPVVHPDHRTQIVALFSQLRADFIAGGSLVSLLAAALIHRLIVVAHGSSSAEPDQPSRTRAMRRAVALIEASALQSLDLHAIADECGIGSSTLRRRFKQLTGQSIAEYILRIRLRRARELLVHTPLSVAEVAHAVGFADPFYFSRLFHLKEGLTPTAFRARQQL